MKRHHLYSILCIILSLALKAQSFHRGAVILDLNTGIEFYKTSQTYQAKTFPNFRDTTINTNAANANLAASVEVGLSKRIGIGLRGKSNSFFRDVDALSKDRTKLKSTDLTFLLNLHPISVEKFDLALGAEAGFSAFNLAIDDIANTITKGNGTYVSLYLNPRFYFGRLGVNIRALMPFANYGRFSSEPSMPDAGNFLLKTWKGNGGGFTVGLQLRLF